MRELDHPPRHRVVDARDGAADRDGREAGVEERDHRVREVGGRLGHLLRIAAARDCGAQPERRASLVRHQVHVVQHSEQAPPGREHRQVPDPLVEHLEQRLGGRTVGGHGPGRGGHHVRQRGLRARARGDHASANVAVGHDPEAVVQLHDDAGRAGLGHLAGRLLHARRGRTDQRRSPDQLSDRPAGGRQRRLGLLPGQEAESLVHHPGHEADEGRALQHRTDDVRGNAVDERVLRGASHKSERSLRQEGDVAEHLALGNQIQQAAVDHELDRPTPHDVGELRDRGTVHDHGARRVELDLGAVGHLGERLLVETVEGRLGAEKLGYVVH